ncbi:hypothetical protein DH2020_014661 [Rehmannia glutinosa]|uniref:DUF985 domain-containing protein n=1 Tax=Rehmannia glutinosa TaxID=99300 RepID=A0ABR0WZL3_REHGL
MASRTATKSEIVEKLNLKPHPEDKVDRPVSTSIYFLLPSGSVSHLHRIPCAETWHFYLGEPLTVLELNEDDGSVKLTCIGPDPLAENQVVQHVVPPNVWFGAFPSKDIDISSDGLAVKRAERDPEEHFSLVGCTCAPRSSLMILSWQNVLSSFHVFPSTSLSSLCSPSMTECCVVLTLSIIEEPDMLQ